MDWTAVAFIGNAVIASAYFGISGVIAVPLLRSGQVRANRLGTATAVIFFSCAVGHLFHVADGTGSTMSVGGLDAIWTCFTAVVAVYYWSLRRTYGSLMRGASLFDDLREQQRVAALEAAQALAEANARTERERAASAAMMRSVLLNSTSSICIRDLDGRYLFANEQYERTFGRLEVDLIGRTPAEAGVMVSARDRDFELQARAGRVTREDDVVTALSVRRLETGWFPLHEAEGTLYGICERSVDVTDQRAAEAQMARARDEALAATAAKSAFLATMSHEIRTPMNAVIGLTGLLLDTDLDPQQRDFVETVRASGDALLDLINDILDYSKIEAGELRIDPQQFDLVELVEGAADLLGASAASKGLRMVVGVDPALPPLVVGDASRIRQVLVNLVGNAVKFTERGEVALAVQGRTDPAGAMRLCFEVTDTGIGIAPQARQLLFRPFSQVDASHSRVYEGTGLGLAISRRLVEAMGGSVEVDSAPGRGSTFRFDVRVTVPAEQPAPAGSRLAGRRVLVVDPSPRGRDAITARLRAWGVDCGEAATPAQAMECMDREWDVVLVDRHLGSPGGGDLATRLRVRAAHRGAAPVLIALTEIDARVDPTSSDAYSEALCRPVKVTALRGALSRAMGLSAALPVQQRRHVAKVKPGQGLRVLLVEDNLVNQKVGRLVLTKLGHVVDTAGNGQEAITAVTERPYDVVLMDIQMPVLDGLSATRRIRAEVPKDRQPVILAMTASVLVSDQEECLAAGMDGHLAKPIREDDLRAALARCSSRRPRRAEPRSQRDHAGTPADPADDDAAQVRAVFDELGVPAEMRQEIALTFLRETGRTLSALADAVTRGDRPAVATQAHRLRSSSDMFGATRLARLLGVIEEAASRDAPGEFAAEWMPAVTREANQIMAAVHAIADGARAT